MPHWLDKAQDLFSAETSDLLELAEIAGYAPDIFYKGTLSDRQLQRLLASSGSVVSGRISFAEEGVEDENWTIDKFILAMRAHLRTTRAITKKQKAGRGQSPLPAFAKLRDLSQRFEPVLKGTMQFKWDASSVSRDVALGTIEACYSEAAEIALECVHELPRHTARLLDFAKAFYSFVYFVTSNRDLARKEKASSEGRTLGLLADVMRQQGDLTGALAALYGAIERTKASESPLFADSRLRLAKLYRAAGDMALALQKPVPQVRANYLSADKCLQWVNRRNNKNVLAMTERAAVCISLAALEEIERDGIHKVKNVKIWRSYFQTAAEIYLTLSEDESIYIVNSIRSFIIMWLHSVSIEDYNMEVYYAAHWIILSSYLALIDHSFRIGELSERLPEQAAILFGTKAFVGHRAVIAELAMEAFYILITPPIEPRGLVRHLNDLISLVTDFPSASLQIEFDLRKLMWRYHRDEE